MARYKLTLIGAVLRDDGVSFILGSRFWQEYQDWLALGNTPDPADQPPPPPPPIDYGTDAATRDNVVDGVVQLRQYLGVASPTLAQSVAALKLLIRAVLLIGQRVL